MKNISTFALSFIVVMLLTVAFIFFSNLKVKMQSKRFQKEQQKKQDFKMVPENQELKQMEIRLNKLKKTKGSKFAGTDREEEFNDLIQQAEYHHWQLSQANTCTALLDKYYAYRDEAKKSANRRLWLTYFGFFFAYLIVIFCVARFSFHKEADFTKSIKLLGGIAIPSLVIAGVHFFVNYYIFNHIDTSGIKDLALVFLGYMAFYLIIFIIIWNGINQKNVNSDLLADGLKGIIMFAGIASALHVWINHSIFYSIKKTDEETSQTLKKLEDEIRCVSNTVDTHRPLKESIPIWKASVYHCINQLTKL